MSATGAAANGVTLLGKTPARADFIRINHGGHSALEFDQWLQRNLEELVLAGQRQAPPARFLFVPSASQEALVGLLAPSRDKAGRAFPISLFFAVPAALAVRRPWVIPVAYASFFAEARALFDALSELDYETLKVRVAAITAPAHSACDVAEATAAKLLAEAPPAALIERLFEGAHDERAACAVHVVAEMARQVPLKPTLVECPVHEPIDALWWLALASRGVQTPISFFWTEAVPPAASRLLLCLAPPPPQTLLCLACPTPQNGRLVVLSDAAWKLPLGSIESARKQMELLLQSPSLGAFLSSPA